MNKKIVVIGTGYIGLPLAIMLARAGYEVIGVDIEENVVNAINEGVLRAEEEVKRIFHEPRVRKNLHAQKTPCPADVFIISVPTPVDEKKRVADLTQVISATESILPHLRSGNLVIVESTIPPLTCRNIVAPTIEKTGLKIGKDVFLCHCPERILPGEVFEEIVTPAEQQALRAWLRERGVVAGPLFGSRNHQPISRWRLDQLMKQYCERAGIPAVKAHMHALKHSCGTHLSAREPDIVAIQDHLGHANIQNTMKYVQIASKRRDEFADRLHDWGTR